MLKISPLESKNLAWGHIFGVDPGAQKNEWRKALEAARALLSSTRLRNQGVRQHGADDFSCRYGENAAVDLLVEPVAQELLMLLNQRGSFARRVCPNGYGKQTHSLVSSKRGAQSCLNAPHIDYACGEKPFGIWVSQEEEVGTRVFMPPWQSLETGCLLSSLVCRGKTFSWEANYDLQRFLDSEQVVSRELPPGMVWVFSSSTIHSRGITTCAIPLESWRDLLHIRFM